MKQLASSLCVSTGLLVLLCASNRLQAADAPIPSSATELTTAVAADDLVTLERRSTSGRPCTSELGLPVNRVFPDGTRELFVVPAGKALVLTDLVGEITRNVNAAWPSGSIGLLTATITGGVANQTVRARAPIDAAAVSAGIATMNLHLQSGVVVDSGAFICLRASVVYSTGVSIANVGTDVRLHGYLIPR